MPVGSLGAAVTPTGHPVAADVPNKRVTSQAAVHCCAPRHKHKRGLTLSDRTFLFLHGIGNADLPKRWLRSLDDALVRAGAESLAERGYDVVAPVYLDLLKGPAPAEDERPRYTYRRPNDQEAERQAAGAYWRNVAELEHLLKTVARPAGVDLPAGVGGALADSLMPTVAGQAHAFRDSGPRRHAVYHRVLKQLPTSGRLVIAAHSLGSVVLADLLYHLPPGLEVDVILTLGSPLGLEPVRRHLQRLRDDFPFPIVGAWLNVAGITDPVTGFRGVASSFPEALDVFVDTGLLGAHDAVNYFEQDVVRLAIDWADHRSAAGAPISGTDVELAMPQGTPPVVAGQQFALRVEQAMPPGERRTRFAAARAQVADDVRRQYADNGVRHPVLGRLLRDNASLLRNVFSSEESLAILLTALPANPVLPYEIKIDDKVRSTALLNLASDLGVPGHFASTVQRAHSKARDAHQSVDVVKVAMLLAGVAAVIAAPALVLAAAPAGLAGGAAVVSGLAALGPGGMLGGLAIVGAVGGVGGTVATTALTSGSSAAVQQNVLFLQALALARRDLHLASRGYAEWYLLCSMEASLASERRRLQRLCDSGARVVKELDLKLKHVQRALKWMRELDLGPRELPFVKPKEITR